MGREQILQGLAGVFCIVSAAVWLSDPKLLAAYTMVSGFGTALLGNLLRGPGQISIAEAEKLRGKSDPPPPLGK